MLPSRQMAGGRHSFGVGLASRPKLKSNRLPLLTCGLAGNVAISGCSKLIKVCQQILLAVKKTAVVIGCRFGLPTAPASPCSPPRAAIGCDCGNGNGQQAISLNSVIAASRFC